MYVKAKSGLTYKISNEEELKCVVEDTYKLIANDCSNWSSDYIVKAKSLGLMNSMGENNSLEVNYIINRIT